MFQLWLLNWKTLEKITRYEKKISYLNSSKQFIGNADEVAVEQ